MRWYSRGIICVLLLASLLLVPVTQACVTISEIYPHPMAGDGNDEWVEIWNSCNRTINLTGISIADHDRFEHELSGLMGANEYIIISNNMSEFNAVRNVSCVIMDLERGSGWLRNEGGDEALILNGSITLDYAEYESADEGISLQRCGNQWVVDESPTPCMPNSCDVEEAPMLPFISDFTYPSEAVSSFDPVNFSFKVSNPLNITAEVQGFIGLEGIGSVACGNRSIGRMNSSAFSCNWTAGGEGAGTEEVRCQPYIVYNGSTIEGTETEVRVEYPEDMGELTLKVQGPEEEARFGEFTHVKALIYTGNEISPMRIVTYIYSPRWISTDLDGETIRTDLNETKTALEMEKHERGQKITLMLPVLITPNCDEEYEEGQYTGRVRIYEDASGKRLAEEKFNLTVSGSNDASCCPECDCPDKKCNSGGYMNSGITDPWEDEDGMLSIVSCNTTVEKGVPFETVVMVRNTFPENITFSIYTYAFNGSKCVSLGKSGDSWKRGWTANQADVTVPSGSEENVTLASRIDESVETGMYSFRVRLREGDETEDITLRLNVTEASPRMQEESSSGQEKDDWKPQGMTDNSTHEEELPSDPPVTGMAAAEEGQDEANILSFLYDSFLSWLASIFKI